MSVTKNPTESLYPKSHVVIPHEPAGAAGLQVGLLLGIVEGADQLRISLVRGPAAAVEGRPCRSASRQTGSAHLPWHRVSCGQSDLLIGLRRQPLFAAHRLRIPISVRGVMPLVEILARRTLEGRFVFESAVGAHLPSQTRLSPQRLRHRTGSSGSASAAASASCRWRIRCTARPC